MLPFLRLGGAGGICVASHLAGAGYAEMIALAKAGDFDAASGSTTSFSRCWRRWL